MTAASKEKGGGNQSAIGGAEEDDGQPRPCSVQRRCRPRPPAHVGLGHVDVENRRRCVQEKSGAGPARDPGFACIHITPIFQLAAPRHVAPNAGGFS